MPQDNQRVALMFTNSDLSLLRENMLQVVEYVVPDLTAQKDFNEIVERDPLSPMVHDFINRLREFDTVQYDGTQITTLVYQYHGTVTTLWIVLMYNGLMSRTELIPGMSLRIPRIQDIRDALNQIIIEGRTPVTTFGSTVI